MAATLTDPLLGHLVDGRYEVLSRIARGGMATVYLAVDRRLDREVALKVMHPHLAEGGTGSEFVARFRREARAAARLTHPGLVGVLDQGVDGETSYLTMEYVEGTNLRRHLGVHGALSVGEALATADAILDALTAAHRVQLVHRDIKPENVLLASDGRIKVADFGLARAVTEVTATTTGTVLGTVAYLSPELVAHGRSDTRTDVYAVGILLYEMLTGAQPFTGATPIQVAYQHVNTDIPAASDVVPWLPAELDELIGALAARDPDQRPTDAGAALELLRRTRAELDVATLTRRADVAPAPARTTADRRAAHPGDPDPGDDGAGFGHRPGDTADTSLPAAGAGADHDGPGDEPVDPDATAALPVAAARTPRHDAEDDDATGHRRTMALQIGSGVEPAARAPRHPRRRLLLLLVTLLALLGGLTAGGWWFMTYGDGAYTAVPQRIEGAEIGAVQEALEQAGLIARPTEVFDPAVLAGVVISATPGEGARILKGGTVDLDVSKGPDLRAVPAELVGHPLADVVAALTTAGLVPGEPEPAFHDTVPLDHVLAVGAEPGAMLPFESVVPLTVSAGPQPITIISVIGEVRDAAVTQLTGQGLVLGEELTAYSEEFEAGRVMAQSPAPDTAGKRTDVVSITVSLGPPLVEVPEIAYMTPVQVARETLTAAGFEVQTVRAGLLNFGLVAGQSPEPGTMLPKGSVVTLTVG